MITMDVDCNVTSKEGNPKSSDPQQLPLERWGDERMLEAYRELVRLDDRLDALEAERREILKEHRADRKDLAEQRKLLRQQIREQGSVRLHNRGHDR